jgi:hypothetical protein
MQVPDSLMERGGFRVPQRERRPEVTERLAISVQRPGVLAGQLEVLRRLRVPASRPVVVRDLACQRSHLAPPSRAPHQRFGHPSVQ